MDRTEPPERLVPVEPTEKMMAAALDADDTDWNPGTPDWYPETLFRAAWKAMVHAAPTRPRMEDKMGDRSNCGLLTADEFRKLLRARYPRENGYTHERIGEELGLSAGFVGMLLDGTRAPSKAALDALKMEKVTFYRLKHDPFTGRPWGEVEIASHLSGEQRDPKIEDKPNDCLSRQRYY